MTTSPVRAALVLAVLVGAIFVLVPMKLSATSYGTFYQAALQCSDDSWVSVQINASYDTNIYCNSGAVVQCYPTTDPCYARVLFLEDLNGGDLEDRDIVGFLTINEFGVFTVAGAGGLPLVRFDPPGTWSWANDSDETQWFEVEEIDCDDCPVGDGSRISLNSIELGKFWSAAGGGGGLVNVNATSRGTYERFELVIYDGPFEGSSPMSHSPQSISK